MNRKIETLGICVLCVFCGFSILYADIIHLKNGSTMEGQIVKETDDEVAIKIAVGTISIKRGDIEKIIKADYTPERKWIEEIPVEETPPIIETQPITPSATVTSTGTSITEQAPFKIGLEPKTGIQTEINVLIERLANLQEGEEPWSIMREITAKGEEDIAYLVGLMNEINQPDVLYYLIQAVGNTRKPEAINPLLEKIKSDDEKIRTAGINALSRFAYDPIVIRVLRAYLNEEQSVNVRMSLINTLAALEDTGALPDFISLLNDPDKSIRYAASNAIVKLHQIVVAESEGEPARGGSEVEHQGRLRRPEIDVVSLLLDRLRRADLQMKKEILTLIGQLKDPRALEALVDLLGDRDAGIRALVAMALGGLKDKKANEYIVERLYEERDTWTKVQLILALQKSRDFSVVSALIDMLQDSDANVRFSAGRTLRAITKRAYGTDYERWQKWWNAFRGK